MNISELYSRYYYVKFVRMNTMSAINRLDFVLMKPIHYYFLDSAEQFSFFKNLYWKKCEGLAVLPLTSSTEMCALTWHSLG